MKLLSLQIAIFSKEYIQRPDLLFNEVNDRLGGIINDIPTKINLPSEAPADIPIVQAKSTDNRININVSRSRIDLFFNFEFQDEASPLESFESQKNNIHKFYKAVLKAIFANRIGFIISMFEPKNDNVKSIYEKYFSENYKPQFAEASMRINKQRIRKSVVYNQIRLIEATSINVGIQSIPGIFFQYDINNVVAQGQELTDDIVSYVIGQGNTLLNPESVKEMI